MNREATDRQTAAETSGDATRERVAAIVRKVIHCPADLSDDTDLSTCGLTSMEALTLVFAIENDFGITIADEDLKLTNFLTIGAIIRLVEAHSA